VDEVRDIFALRRWIEPEIAGEVAGKFTKKDESTIKTHLDQEQAARERGDRIEATRLAGLFHSAICSCSHNRLAAGYVNELVDRSFLAIYLYQRTGELMCVNEEHFAIAAAFKRKDIKKARELMAKHLEHILKRMDLVQGGGVSADLSQAFRGLI
jgi:DNA-binding GntR family transcriptional regulator